MIYYILCIIRNATGGSKTKVMQFSFRKNAYFLLYTTCSTKKTKRTITTTTNNPSIISAIIYSSFPQMTIKMHFMPSHLNQHSRQAWEKENCVECYSHIILDAINSRSRHSNGSLRGIEKMTKMNSLTIKAVHQNVHETAQKMLNRER